MKLLRYTFSAMLIITLLATSVGSAFADGAEPTGVTFSGKTAVTTYADVKTDPKFVHKEGGASYVRNGAFDDWTAGKPNSWTLSDLPGVGAGLEARWSQLDLAKPGSAKSNYGLGLFLRNTGTQDNITGVAFNKLVDIKKAGNYWVVLHATSWGTEGFYLTSQAYYAIVKDPNNVKSSDWRELYSNSDSCVNGVGRCLYFSRKETVRIEPGSYLLVRGSRTAPEYNNWSMFVFDDIAIADVTPLQGQTIWCNAETVLGADVWCNDGVVTWDKNATR